MKEIAAFHYATKDAQAEGSSRLFSFVTVSK
jgi:hypothetical protein